MANLAKKFTGMIKQCTQSDLQVITGFLAIGDSLDLSGRCEVQGLALVWETEGSGYPHVCQGKVVHI